MNTAVLENLAGRLIDGRFALLDWLGSTGTDAIYCTELPGQPPRLAAIRLVVAAPENEELLNKWELGNSLAHPHLLQIIAHGRAHEEDVDLFYVVMELPEEALDQILPERPLTADETAEMLPPILDALAFLHGKGIVHGHLQPANVLVVGEHLKLSSDSLEHAEAPHRSVVTKYDAPELAGGVYSAAADVWSLGMTIVEALTQQRPAFNGETGSVPLIPESVPPPFAEIVHACLQLDPARRCSVADIHRMLHPEAAQPDVAPIVSAAPEGPEVAAVIPAAVPIEAANAAPVVAPVPPMVPPPAELAEVGELQPPRRPLRTLEDEEPRRKAAVSRKRLPFFIGAAVLLLFLVTGLWVYSHRSPAVPEASQPIENVAPAPPPQRPAPPPAHSVERKSLVKGQVASRELPDIPAKAYQSIRGKVDPRIRVNVDRNGSVTEASIVNDGHSRYFARKALEAARHWKFKPAEVGGRAEPSVWMIQFEFHNNRTDVRPTEVSP